MLKKFDKKFFRFILVGLINTLVGTSIMFLSYNLLGLSYWISSGANYFFGSILSFFLNKYFTFQSKEKSFGQVLRFILNISICYFLAYGLAKPLATKLLENSPVHIQENIALVVGMVLFVILNYLGQNLFVFKKSED